MAKSLVKKPRKVYLTPQEDAALERLAKLRSRARGELIEPSPLARELLVPAILAELEKMEAVPA